MTQWLFDTFVWTGCLIALVLAVRRPVARHFGPQVAYALWALPLLRFVLPPVELPASFAPADHVPLDAVPLPPVAAGDPLVTLPLVMGPAASGFDWAGLLLALWLGGALAFLVWRGQQYRAMRADLLADARPVGEAGRVRLVETPAVSAPVAFGVADKVVALPPLFMAQANRAARDLAIAHELAHHRGHDLLANIAAQPLLALHWFNPLAWAGWRAMRRDQEAACDARVVAGREQAEKATYARVIAGFPTGQRLALAAPMACPMASPLMGEKSIIHRLRSLTMADVSAARRHLGLAAIASTALVALPLTASISYAQPEVLPVPPAPPVTHQAGQRMVIIDNPAGSAIDDPTLHTREVRRADGTTVILRTPQPLSEAEAQRRVAEALATVPPVPALNSPPSGRRVVIHSEDDAADAALSKVELAEALTDAREGIAEAQRALAEERAAMQEQHRAVEVERQTRRLAKADAAFGAVSGLRQAQAAIRRVDGLSTDLRQRILRDLQAEIEQLEQAEISQAALSPPRAALVRVPVVQVHPVPQPPAVPKVPAAPQPPAVPPPPQAPHAGVAPRDKPMPVRMVIDGAVLLAPLPFTVTAS